MNYQTMTIRAGTYTRGYSAPRVPLTVAVPVSAIAMEATQRAFNDHDDVVEIVWDAQTNQFLDEPILARPITSPETLSQLEAQLHTVAV